MIACVAAMSAHAQQRALLDYTAWRSTRIEARDGTLLGHRVSPRGGFGTWVTRDQISQSVIDATLASEDSHFEKHIGIDPIGIARAVMLNIKTRRVAYGGSTITQQLAKQVDPQPRTLLGKLSEALDALSIEAHYDKTQILEHYLNRVYYGRNAYGIEAAAQRYFSKHASELTLDEGALLAVLPRAPSRYDLLRHPEAALSRRAHILDLMAEQGRITQAQAHAAKNKPIALSPLPASPRLAPHFADAVVASHPLHQGTLHTTLDISLQQQLEARLAVHLARVEQSGITQSGVVVVHNATGHVLALVGSGAYGDELTHGSINALTMKRHPGSALKPFVYALAVEQGAHALTPVMDVPMTARGHSPRSMDRRYFGVVSLAEALGSSLNTPATRIAGQVGSDHVAEAFAAFGIDDTIAPHLATPTIALGDHAVALIDVAEAYATLARGGEHRDAVMVQGDASRNYPVVSAQTAYLVGEMLSDADARRLVFGLETPFDLPFQVAAKTGTSQAYVDNVAAAYTSELTFVAWAGNFDGVPTHHVRAMDGIAPLLREALIASAETYPPHTFTQPEGIASVEVCARSGMLPGLHCATHAHVHVNAAHAPSETCTWHDANGEALPAEVRGWQQDAAHAPLATTGDPFLILGLRDDAHLVIDPALPRVSQQLALRIAVSDADVRQVRWEIDGQLVAQVNAPFSAFAPMTPGRHVVRAISVGSGSNHRAQVTVSITEGT